MSVRPDSRPICGIRALASDLDSLCPRGVLRDVSLAEISQWRLGGALVSPLHATFIVNDGGTRAADVLALIGEIARRVTIATGHRLEAEARYITPPRWCDFRRR